MIPRLLVAFVTMVSATPVWARDSATVPEGSHLTLFALGVLGVIIGRRAAISAQRRQRGKDSEAE